MKPQTSDEAFEVERLRLRTMALSRWEEEGAAVVESLSAAATMTALESATATSAAAAAAVPCDGLALVHTESVQLRIRVIALENLLIALLAQAPAAHLKLAREMADHISPRPGYTPHPLTLRAADEMRSLVQRAGPFRDLPEV